VFLGFGCSFFAFAGFLITADSLDSMFNTFRKHDNRLHRYFYRSILYQRYLSVIALITALILIVTFLQPAYGILSIILLYNMGRRHWFPPAKLL